MHGQDVKATQVSWNQGSPFRSTPREQLDIGPFTLLGTQTFLTALGLGAVLKLGLVQPRAAIAVVRSLQQAANRRSCLMSLMTHLPLCTVCVSDG